MFCEAAVQDRDEHQGDERGDAQTPGHRGTQAAPHLRAFAPAQGHGQHTQHGGERGHQDGAQTALGRLHGRLPHAVAALLQQNGIVDEHDTVLHHNTQQDDNANQRHHANGHICHQVTHRHAHQGERNGEHDHERPHERLELRRHYHVHQNHNQDHQHEHVAEHILLVLIVTANLPAKALRKRVLAEQAGHGFNALAQGFALRQDTGHLNVTVAVLALDGGRHLGFHNAAQVLYTDAPALLVINHDVLNVLQGGTELRRIANANVVLLTVLAVERAHGTGHGRGNGSRRRHG